MIKSCLIVYLTNKLLIFLNFELLDKKIIIAFIN